MHGTNKPRVEIVIVNWNKKDDVLACLDSVFALDYDNYEVIVVDNASTDGSVEAIREKYGNKLALITNCENLGGTGGFNMGLKEALKREGEYVYLLDNDVVVDRKALIELVNALEEDEQKAFAGSRVYNFWNSGEIWSEGEIIENNANEQNLILIKHAPACSLLVRKSTIKEVGLMDERFFLFADDRDWCYRFYEKGYTGVCVRSSIVKHKAKKGFAFYKSYYDVRNNLLLIKKHSTNSYERFINYSKYIICHGIPRRFLGNIFKGMLKLDIERLKGAKAACLGLLDFIRERYGRREF